MIVNNTCPNVRIFAYKDAKNIQQTCYIFPGVNGEIPEAVAESESFKEQRDLDLLKIITTKKPIPIDPTRAGIAVDRIAVVPDNDVVEAMLDMEEKKALMLLPDITKRATLISLKAREKRASLIQAIEKQIEDIDKLNTPARK